MSVFAAAVLLAMSGAAPASAAKLDPSVPVWSIKNIGDAVATRDMLSIDDVVLDIGYLGTQEIKFVFELDGTCCESNYSSDKARFLADQPDAACDAVGAAPTRVVECTYTREVVSGVDLHFDFRHRITRPAPFGRPGLRMTIVLRGTDFPRGLQVRRVAPVSDFVIKLEGPGEGQVGGIVDFAWSVTNVGLDPVWDRAGMITFIAPAGTEFADTLANTSPADMMCVASGSVQTRRECWFNMVNPGPANRKQATWRLKILSAEVGEGKVEANLRNPFGIKPEGDFADPTPGNNVAPIHVRLAPSTNAPGNGSSPGELTVPAGSAVPGQLPSGSVSPGEQPPAGETGDELTRSAVTGLAAIGYGQVVVWAAALMVALASGAFWWAVRRRKLVTVPASDADGAGS